MALSDVFVKAGETSKVLFKKISVFTNKTKTDEVINAFVPVDAFGSEIQFARNATLTDGSQKTEVTASVLPTGAATESTLVDIETKLNGTVNVNTGLVQSLTDTELRASPVNVSASSLPLPTGAATSAQIDTLNQNIVALTKHIAIQNYLLAEIADTDYDLNELLVDTELLDY